MGASMEVPRRYSSLSDEAYLRKGLQVLGIRYDTDESVFHTWARSLPAGMFDGHRSVLTAPDHLIFHGLTHRLVDATFKLLKKEDRVRVGVSLREALAQSQFTSTRIYNETRDKVSAVGVSEWAATLTVFSFAVRRVQQDAHTLADTDTTPLQTALKVVDSFTSLVCAIYFFPRVDLDGAPACRARQTMAEIKRLADVFFERVDSACRCTDTEAFGFRLDVPNLHRLRELVEFVLPFVGHVRHLQELLFENAHQPLKRAVVTGSGRDDAGRAMTRFLQGELASRMALDPEYFGLTKEWVEHKGIRAELDAASPLWSAAGGVWRCSGGKLGDDLLPDGAQVVASHYFPTGTAITWRGRATRGGKKGNLLVGDAVGVPVSPYSDERVVPVAEGAAVMEDACAVRFFLTAAFFTTRSGLAAALVYPFSPISGSTECFVRRDWLLFLPLKACVRRALVLHACGSGCEVHAPQGVVLHSEVNRWQVFGRAAGYPSRSG